MDPSQKRPASPPLTEGLPQSGRFGHELSGEGAIPRPFLEALPDAVALTSVDGSIQFCNSSWCRFFSKPLDQWIQQSLFDGVGGDFSALLRRGWQQIELGRPWNGTLVEQENRTPSQNRAVDLHLYPWPNSTAGAESVLVLVRPATRGDGTPDADCNTPLLPIVLGTIAHDMNNITTVMNCTLDLALHGEVPSADDLREIQGSIKEVEQLVAALMLLCGRAPLERSLCRVSDILQRARKLMRHALPHGCSVASRSSAEDDSLSVLADPIALEFVIVCMAYSLIHRNRQVSEAVHLAVRPELRADRSLVAVEVSTSTASNDAARRDPTPAQPVTAHDIAPSPMEETFLQSALLAHQARLEMRIRKDGSPTITLVLPNPSEATSHPAGGATGALARRILILGGTPLARAALLMPLETRGFCVVSAAGDAEVQSSAFLRNVDAVVIADVADAAASAKEWIEGIRRVEPNLPIVVLGSTRSFDPLDPMTRSIAQPHVAADVADILDELMNGF